METRTETVSEADYEEKWGWDRSELDSDLVESKKHRSSAAESDITPSSNTQYPHTIETTDFAGFTIFEWRHIIRWDYDTVGVSVSNTSHYDQVLYTDPGWAYNGTVSSWDSVNSSCGCIYTAYMQADFEGYVIDGIFPLGTAYPYSELEGDYVGNGFVNDEYDGAA